MNGFNRHECSSWSEHFRFNVAIKETLFFYFFIFVILFAGLREIGADRDSLLYQFYYLNGYLVDNHFGFEPGFEALIYLSNKIIGLGFYLFIFMIALLSISIKFYAYKLIFRHAMIAFSIYFLNYIVILDMTQIRIGLALSVLLLSVVYIVNRKVVKFLLTVAIATCFHYTAIIFVFAYFFYRSKVNYFYVYFIMFLGFALSSFIEVFIYFLSQYDQVPIFFKLQAYLNSKSNFELIIYNYSTLLTFLVFSFIVIFIKNKSKFHNFSLMLFAFQIVISSLLSFNIEISNRMFSMLDFFSVVFLFYILIEYFKFNPIVIMLVFIYFIRNFIVLYSNNISFL